MNEILLINSIKQRLRTELRPNNPLKHLQGLDPATYIFSVVNIIYLHTRQGKRKGQRASMAEVISQIGHEVRDSLKLRKDSANAAKTGAFILYTFEEFGILKVSMGSGVNGHGQYLVEIKDDLLLEKLWLKMSKSSTTRMPICEPYAPWKTSRHATGASMVKTKNKEVLSRLNIKDTPMVFNAINKVQSIGWQVNFKIYEVHLWAFKNRMAVFDDIWKMQSPEGKASKMREVKIIGQIAGKFLDKTFYHLYFLDFRGRLYPTTAYLHEQGTDLAKGLLLRSEGKPIGEGGFKWLMIGLATLWGGSIGDSELKTDKIPLKDRYEWAVDNEEILISYAVSPRINKGWMEADSPWQFLAGCMELKALRDWQFESFDQLGYGCFDNFEFITKFVIYIDGSTNGLQHLTALTKDEKTAPHVNLVPLELPGDLYKYIGEHIWARLAKLVESLSVHEMQLCEKFIDELIELKGEVQRAEPASPARKEKIGKLMALKEANPNLMAMAAPLFWLRIKDSKSRRKIVKR